MADYKKSTFTTSDGDATHGGRKLIFEHSNMGAGIPNQVDTIGDCGPIDPLMAKLIPNLNKTLLNMLDMIINNYKIATAKPEVKGESVIDLVLPTVSKVVQEQLSHNIFLDSFTASSGTGVATSLSATNGFATSVVEPGSGTHDPKWSRKKIMDRILAGLAKDSQGNLIKSGKIFIKSEEPGGKYELWIYDSSLKPAKMQDTMSGGVANPDIVYPAVGTDASGTHHDIPPAFVGKGALVNTGLSLAGNLATKTDLDNAFNGMINNLQVAMVQFANTHAGAPGNPVIDTTTFGGRVFLQIQKFVTEFMKKAVVEVAHTLDVKEKLIVGEKFEMPASGHMDLPMIDNINAYDQTGRKMTLMQAIREAMKAKEVDYTLDDLNFDTTTGLYVTDAIAPEINHEGTSFKGFIQLPAPGALAKNMYDCVLFFRDQTFPTHRLVLFDAGGKVITPTGNPDEHVMSVGIKDAYIDKKIYDDLLSGTDEKIDAVFEYHYLDTAVFAKAASVILDDINGHKTIIDKGASIRALVEYIKQEIAAHKKDSIAQEVTTPGTGKAADVRLPANLKKAPTSQMIMEYVENEKEFAIVKDDAIATLKPIKDRLMNDPAARDTMVLVKKALQAYNAQGIKIGDSYLLTIKKSPMPGVIPASSTKTNLGGQTIIKTFPDKKSFEDFVNNAVATNLLPGQQFIGIVLDSTAWTKAADPNSDFGSIDKDTWVIGYAIHETTGTTIQYLPTGKYWKDFIISVWDDAKQFNEDRKGDIATINTELGTHHEALQTLDTDWGDITNGLNKTNFIEHLKHFDAHQVYSAFGAFEFFGFDMPAISATGAGTKGSFLLKDIIERPSLDGTGLANSNPAKTDLNFMGTAHYVIEVTLPDGTKKKKLAHRMVSFNVHKATGRVWYNQGGADHDGIKASGDAQYSNRLFTENTYLWDYLKDNEIANKKQVEERLAFKELVIAPGGPDGAGAYQLTPDAHLANLKPGCTIRWETADGTFSAMTYNVKSAPTVLIAMSPFDTGKDFFHHLAIDITNGKVTPSLFNKSYVKNATADTFLKFEYKRD